MWLEVGLFVADDWLDRVFLHARQGVHTMTVCILFYV